MEEKLLEFPPPLKTPVFPPPLFWRYLSNKSYKSSNEDNYFDSSVLKDIPETNEFYTKEFFTLFENEDLPEEVKQQKRELVTKINDILIKGFDKTGHLSAKLLFENCTLDELEELGNYIKELKSYKSKKTTTSEISPEFYKELTYYRTTINKDVRKANIWKKIFLDYHFNEDGNYVATENKETGQLPNTLIYSILKPKDEYKDKFIDKEKSEAKQFIDDMDRMVFLIHENDEKSKQRRKYLLDKNYAFLKNCLSNKKEIGKTR